MRLWKNRRERRLSPIWIEDKEFYSETEYKSLIDEFLEDLETVVIYAEEPSLNPDLTFSFKDYNDLINGLYKKWEKKKKNNN